MKHIKPWHLFIICIVTAAIGIHAVRQNNIKMALLREDVFIADKQNEPIDEPLNVLRDYIAKHMGTSTDVPLKYSYERATKKVLETTTDVNGKPSDIFADLPASCASGGFIDSTKPCVKDHINQKLAQLGTKQVALTQVPDKKLFNYSFSAPIISYDLAGMSLVVAALSGIYGLCLVIWRFFRAELAYYKGDIDGL
jgi:hypothetical protein